MKAHNKFKKSVLSTSISLLLCGAAATPVMAQQDNNEASDTEVIQVSGIRSSLQEAASIKRTSVGVVDAISAEDIGKFPDTNLAESLQRITGVSISRENGEGAEITVRGFGGGANMITLNGRMMPAGGVDANSSDPTRAFDFANLASESVSAVEVYKTSKADIVGGGIGATVNILTARPLENPTMRSTIGVKAVHDTTNRTGDDITPEISGIYNYVNDDETFGVTLSGSFQKRDSGSTGVFVNGWNVGVWGEDDLYNRQGRNEIFENMPDEGQLYARPDDFRYAFSDFERERTNGQATFQYRPMDELTATLDYTYAQNDIVEQRGELGNWIQNGNNLERVVFDNSAVATPISISERYAGVVDQGYAQQYRAQVNELKSLGFNLDYQYNDDLNLRFDIHDSSLESLPNGPSDSDLASSSIGTAIGAPVVAAKTLIFDGEIPLFTTELNDNFDRGGLGLSGNGNGVLDVGDVGSSIGQVDHYQQVTDITQIRFDGTYEFDDGQFDFGLESRAMEMKAQRTAWLPMNLGGWSIANPGEFPEGMIQPFDYNSEFEDYDINQPNIGFRGNSAEMMRYILGIYPGPNNNFAPNPIFSTRDTVEEDIFSAYFQVALQGELGGMETNFLAGVRYEKTDVTSSSLFTPPAYLLWASDNDFSSFTPADTEVQPIAAESDYDHVLPSMDFDIMLTENLKGRFSFSKTIARAGYGALRASFGGFGTNGSTLLASQPTANSSNPGLVPLESDNFDLSLEYYYDDSYISVGFFEKRVSNFIGTGTVDLELFGIRDQTAGPRAQAAIDALQELGVAVDNRSLFTMMGIIQQGGSPADYTGTEQQVQDIELAVDIVPNADDPLMEFRVTRPLNSEDAEIRGAEFAIQHFFGETGFGFQANYTIVNGDVAINTEAPPDESQFALVGLSDTANFVGFYEKDGFAARIAWNWRDDYLATAARGGSNNPIFVEAYDQIDVNLSYDFNDQLTVFLEGINVTGENERSHMRNERMIWTLNDLGARYQLGVRYVF
uniref:TonB-dependent receptor n=1 Tax=Ningiella ruwaisensis TaxID=2364274 RepID=UPI0010A0857E|nr:TonB-dependent receptor [Ningiella ruwaisensis]